MEITTLSISAMQFCSICVCVGKKGKLSMRHGRGFVCRSMHSLLCRRPRTTARGGGMLYNHF